jgi:hypothetical protein
MTAAQLALALRTQADALVNGDLVTGLERINLLYEAADYIEGGSSSSLTPGAGDATQGAKNAEPGTATDRPATPIVRRGVSATRRFAR